MPESSGGERSGVKHAPGSLDIQKISRALRAAGVDHAVIGGCALALYGMPRMTKDIDLILPVDPENNRKLIGALADIEGNDASARRLSKEWMDKGHSTELAGKVPVDLLYVAAGRTFEDVSAHLCTVNFHGEAVTTLDIDGLLQTKQTDRPQDAADRLKLERLRDAQRETRLRNERVAALDALGTKGLPGLIRRAILEAIGRAAGEANAVRWTSAHEDIAAQCLAVFPSEAEALANLLSTYSPGAIYPSQQMVTRDTVARIARTLKVNGAP
jgi:hypothetical protein